MRTKNSKKKWLLRLSVILALLLTGGLLFSLDALNAWADKKTAADNQRIVGNERVLVPEGGPSGPFSLTFEVTEVTTTIKGILVIQLDPGYSLIDLDFDSNDVRSFIMVYQSPDGLIETVTWTLFAPTSYKGITITPQKIRVLEDQ